jgi:hypothetical protein
MAFTIYILISFVMLYGGAHLLFRVFTKVKDPLFQELFVIIGIGLILAAVCVFIAGIGMQRHTAGLLGSDRADIAMNSAAPPPLLSRILSGAGLTFQPAS